MHRLASACAVLAVLSLSVAARTPAPSATVRGRVSIPNPLSATLPRPSIAELGHDMSYQPSAPRRAVVYLETAPQEAFEETGGARATMKQEHETFVPHLLAIRVGTVVEFPNADPFFHNVFSLSKTRPFDLGRYARGRSKAVQFNEPGIVRVFCDIHSHMSAFILVFAHRYFAITDEEGRYRIERVPPGTYTLTAWYEAVAQQSRTVTVPEQGGTVDLDFTLRDR
jgi:plastocyanin